MAKQVFSPRQTMAARALLNWAAKDLAQKCSLAPAVLAKYERGERQLSPEALGRLRDVLKGAGIHAIPAGRAGEGVRFRFPHWPARPGPAARLKIAAARASWGPLRRRCGLNAARTCRICRGWTVTPRQIAHSQ